MRERIRRMDPVGVLVCSCTHKKPPGESWGKPYADFTLHYTPQYERIVDVASRSWIPLPGGRRRAVMHPVCHERWKFDFVADWSMVQVDSQNEICLIPAAHLCQYHIGQTTDLGLYAASAAMVSRPTATAGHYDRWLKVKPTMVSRANMSVFLYELRDIKRMFDVLPRKHFKLSSWRDVLTYVNGQHLNYNFGWKPFLSDIKNVVKGLSSFETRLNRFCSDAGTDLSRRYIDQAISLDSTSEFQLTWHANWYCKHVRTGEARNASTFQFTYAAPTLEAGVMRWRAYLDTLGLNPTIANVWRVLPWSFVVDWFFNVSKVLDQYSEDWIQPYIYFIQGCSSTKSEAVVKTYLQYRGTYTSAWLPTFNVSHSLYDRRVGTPSFELETDPLNADKIRLLASLALSKVKL